MRFLATFIFTKLLGWKIEGDMAPHIKKAVVIVVPHTSWHDFYIGAFTRKILNLQINFIAKKELFKFPFGWYFKWMGGAPIDRKSNQNMVQQAVEIFKSREEFRLAIAPEGTRKKVEKWKSGFYYIALKAEIPIIPVAFDYKTKTVKIDNPFYPSGNFPLDIEKLTTFFNDVEGKIKAYS